MNLRPATMDDAIVLLGWRNDPVTRAGSRDDGLVSLDDHVHWLALHLYEVFIAEHDGTAIGTGRRSADNELSVTVAPEHRGQGYARQIVKALAAMGTASWAACKRTNAPSMIAFLHEGFLPYALSETYLFLQRGTV